MGGRRNAAVFGKGGDHLLAYVPLQGRLQIGSAVLNPRPSRKEAQLGLRCSPMLLGQSPEVGNSLAVRKSTFL